MTDPRNEQTEPRLPKELHQLLAPHFGEDVLDGYVAHLNKMPKLRSALTDYFNDPRTHPTTTPLFIYHEETNEWVTIMANNTQSPDQVGEPGSILAHIRHCGYNETLLCSDCYGQLSCSSCAIEILSGTLENPIPREEEYDMLDIDESKPPTNKTRLGCQAILGNHPMVISIRAPQKKGVSKR